MALSVFKHWEETAIIGDRVSIVAHPPEVDPQAEPVYPGEVVLYCVVEITNATDRPFEYDLFEFNLYARDRTSAGGLFGKLAPESQQLLPAGPLAPGATVRGAVPFELPQEQVATVEKLLFHRVLNGVTWSVYWSEDGLP